MLGKNFRTVKKCNALLHGQKLLECQKKLYVVIKWKKTLGGRGSATKSAGEGVTEKVAHLRRYGFLIPVSSHYRVAVPIPT